MGLLGCVVLGQHIHNVRIHSFSFTPITRSHAGHPSADPSDSKRKEKKKLLTRVGHRIPRASCRLPEDFERAKEAERHPSRGGGQVTKRDGEALPGTVALAPRRDGETVAADAAET